MIIELYTKPGCPACQRTKQILENMGYSYIEYEMGRNITRDELKARFPDATHVPIIIVDQQKIKSADEMKLLLERDERGLSLKMIQDGY